MDATDLSRINGALWNAIADANARRNETGIDEEFRANVRLARITDGHLLRTLTENPELSTDRLRAIGRASNELIAQLEALTKMPDGQISDAPEPGL